MAKKIKVYVSKGCDDYYPNQDTCIPAFHNRVVGFHDTPATLIVHDGEHEQVYLKSELDDKSFSSIDEKVKRLLSVTDQFVFIEHYAHTGSDMYKIHNQYTKYSSDKRVLCPLSDGIGTALDIAYQIISEEKKKFYSE